MAEDEHLKSQEIIDEAELHRSPSGLGLFLKSREIKARQKAQRLAEKLQSRIEKAFPFPSGD